MTVIYLDTAEFDLALTENKVVVSGSTPLKKGDHLDLVEKSSSPRHHVTTVTRVLLSDVHLLGPNSVIYTS